jgi:hypothetical protein
MAAVCHLGRLDRVLRVVGMGIVGAVSFMPRRPLLQAPTYRDATPQGIAEFVHVAAES